jgi:simple sugar transport system permease protein
MDDFFSLLRDVFTIGVGASTIRLATPFIFAAMGETFGQRSGVLNLGVDGQMLMGAFCGFYVAYESGSLILGVLAALGIGLLMGLAMAFISVTLQAEQGISGIGVYLFGLGMSTLLYQRTLGTPSHVNGFPNIHIPLLSDIPILGEIFFSQNLLVYLAFALVPLSAWVISNTTFGLQIRAVGQHPEAADAMGVSVARVRYTTVVLGGMLSALAGASISIALRNVYQENLTAGMGFIAVALVYFGGWRPVNVMLGALLFSFVQALQLQVQIKGYEDIPVEFAAMAPYVVTIIALIFASKRQEQPTALTKPFDRGE